MIGWWVHLIKIHEYCCGCFVLSINNVKLSLIDMIKKSFVYMCKITLYCSCLIIDLLYTCVIALPEWVRFFFFQIVSDPASVCGSIDSTNQHVLLINLKHYFSFSHIEKPTCCHEVVCQRSLLATNFVLVEVAKNLFFVGKRKEISNKIRWN